MFERQKHAYIARGWVQRADECDDEQGTEVLNYGESDPGDHHHDGSCGQQSAAGETVRDNPNRQGEGGGAYQGRRRNDPDLESIEAERGQVGGKQYADQPVAEGAQSPG